jgi:hypothetical protein
MIGYAYRAGSRKWPTNVPADNRYTCFIDLYGTHKQIKAIAEEHLRGHGYVLREDAFTRNGLEVHRIYLVDRQQYVRLASQFFDAFNWCRFCRSFDVSFYQGLTGTIVYCHDCHIHRGYRADNPSGYDPVNPALPSFYQLRLTASEEMHPSTFEYLEPTEAQKATMGEVRLSFARLAADLDRLLPDGADKTFVLRQLRTCGMWANVAITREADGTPRKEP